MLDLDNLTTKKGAKIKVRFERKKSRDDLNKEYSQEQFEKKLNDEIEFTGIDTGKGTIIYVLFNEYDHIFFLDENQYIKWNSNSKKDWFHLVSKEIILVAKVGDLLEEMFTTATNMRPN